MKLTVITEKQGKIEKYWLNSLWASIEKNLIETSRGN